MPTFLFWNVNRRNLGTEIGKLVAERSVEILVLAESLMDPQELVREINAASSGIANYFYAPTIVPNKRISIFVRYDNGYIQPQYDGKHVSIRRVIFPSQPELLLAAVHMPSLYAVDECDLTMRASEVAREIVETEKIAGHTRTVVVGDFNMNPFAQGMVSAGAFNAVGQRHIAAKVSRNIYGSDRDFFYNPMWRFFAEREGSPWGTYFYPPSGYESIYWHIFDQVIIRPELIPRLDHKSIDILSKCGGDSLMNKPFTKPAVSDHLPIVFSIN